eukprot:scaffold31887_cov35-Attheya_sp.AAC.1
MGQADIKFKTLKQKGSWNAPTPEDEKILALQSEVKSLKKTYKKKPNPSAKEGKKPEADGKVGKPGWLRHNRKPFQKESKKPKTWNDSKYYWCSKETGGKCTGKWRTHKPGDDCKGLEFRKQNDDAKEKREICF